MSIRLHLLFSVGFVLLLVIAAAGGMLHVTLAQTEAAAQIAVAARQPTLSQQVAKQSLVYARSRTAADATQLKALMASFERSAKVLIEGGKIAVDGGAERDVPALDDALAADLGKRELELWGPTRAACQKLIDSEGTDVAALDEIVRLNGELLDKSNALIERMFAVSKRTLGRLLMIEAAVITLGLLAGIVALEIGRRISTAVVRLTEKSEAVSQGNVDLAIDVPGPAEIGSLGKSLDRMRISLKKSMEMLQRKAA
ncbi:MAG: HAMP domain-containing protein [Deltaproteobacteria bacterium]|nr:HAMP domain-containing protein [Deltaproteobacteria bacterium]